MKYITITSRHHDGFAMFDSKVSDWNIVKRTPYAKDPLKQLAEEAHRQGIKLFFYYSQLDWHTRIIFHAAKPPGTTAAPITAIGILIWTITWTASSANSSPITAHRRYLV